MMAKRTFMFQLGEQQIKDALIAYAGSMVTNEYDIRVELVNGSRADVLCVRKRAPRKVKPTIQRFVPAPERGREVEQ